MRRVMCTGVGKGIDSHRFGGTSKAGEMEWEGQHIRGDESLVHKCSRVISVPSKDTKDSTLCIIVHERNGSSSVPSFAK
jgi:hypothetical protein